MVSGGLLILFCWDFGIDLVEVFDVFIVVGYVGCG